MSWLQLLGTWGDMAARLTVLHFYETGGTDVTNDAVWTLSPKGTTVLLMAH